MIDQVAALHPGIKWFHVGADEVSDNFTFQKEDDKFLQSKVWSVYPFISTSYDISDTNDISHDN